MIQNETNLRQIVKKRLKKISDFNADNELRRKKPRWTFDNAYKTTRREQHPTPPVDIDSRYFVYHSYLLNTDALYTLCETIFTLYIFSSVIVLHVK